MYGPVYKSSCYSSGGKFGSIHYGHLQVIHIHNPSHFFINSEASQKFNFKCGDYASLAAVWDRCLNFQHFHGNPCKKIDYLSINCRRIKALYYTDISSILMSILWLWQKVVLASIISTIISQCNYIHHYFKRGYISISLLLSKSDLKKKQWEYTLTYFFRLFLLCCYG